MDVTLAVVNGQVITMKDHQQAEAFAVCKDRIVKVGSTEEVLKLTNPMTKIIDLKGKTALPGFIDTHLHIVGYGFAFEAVDLLGVKSMKELVERCKAYIAEKKVPEGTWVMGRGFDQNAFADVEDFPTSKDLNAISIKHPVLLIRTCGHIGIVNDKALEVTGVDKETFIRGGSFDQYTDGSPNGVIREASLEWFKQQMAYARSVEDLKRAITTGSKVLNQFGITTIHTEDSYDLGYSGNLENLHEAYKQLIIEGKLTQRIYQKISLPRMENLKAFLEGPLRTGMGNDYFRIGPVKLWADGTIGAHTAFMLEDYSDLPEGGIGIAVYENDEIREMIELTHRSGMQMCIHAIGDGALKQVVDAYDEVIQKYSDIPHRHRIVHCQIGNDDLYKKLAKNGLNINIQPMQTETDYPLIEYRLGKERIKRCHAWRSLIDYGVTITGSSDVPCTNSFDAADVFIGIDAVVNRTKWLPEEAVTAYEALEMYTVNAAYAAFEEEVKGSLEEGKLADFVIATGNPLEEGISIKDIKVEQTFVGGIKVYEA
ncbi:MAG: amidohydrolase [Eubacteriales bacterium]|nr:amidohydrolase [Eubacteriales bacterium]